MHSEWTKFRTVRATLWLLVAVIGLVPAMAVLLVAATLSLQPDDTILGGSFTGATLVQMIAGILGVLVMSSEYGTRTIRVTFAARPQRITVLGAKAVVVAAVTFAATVPAGWLAYVIGTAMLSDRGYPPGDPNPAMFGVALCVAAVAVLGWPWGTLLRHSAAAVAVVLAVVVLPSLFGPLFGDLQRWVTGASPRGVIVALVPRQCRFADTTTQQRSGTNLCDHPGEPLIGHDRACATTTAPGPGGARWSASRSNAEPTEAGRPCPLWISEFSL